MILGDVVFSATRLFQFLIGTLKTPVLAFCCLRLSLFQFLIGTLKTSNCNVSGNPGIFVSIPHRYAKNGCSAFSASVISSPVSIPHRYAKNLVTAQYFPLCLQPVSIPHRYAKNIMCPDHAGIYPQSFNSS